MSDISVSNTNSHCVLKQNRVFRQVGFNLVLMALFPGFGGGAGKATEKHPGDEVDRIVNYNIRILKLE